MRPYTAEAWRDDVTEMESVLKRLEDRVPGLRWVRPVAADDSHLLVWTGGRHEEKRLGRLCDWANEEWPP